MRGVRGTVTNENEKKKKRREWKEWDLKLKQRLRLSMEGSKHDVTKVSWRWGVASLRNIDRLDSGSNAHVVQNSFWLHVYTKESRSAYNTYTCEVLTAYYLWNYLEVSSDSRTPLPHPVITILGLKRSPQWLRDRRRQRPIAERGARFWRNYRPNLREHIYYKHYDFNFRLRGLLTWTGWKFLI